MSAGLLTVMISIGASLVAAELFGWTGIASKWLVQRAVRRLPEQHRERYYEEWLGEMDAMREVGPLTRLAWASAVFLRSGRMARIVESTPRILGPHDLIWGRPDAEIERRAYEQACREIAKGNLDTEIDETEEAYRLQFAKWIALPPGTFGKRGPIEILPGASVKIAPLTFNLLVRIWKRSLLSENEE